MQQVVDISDHQTNHKATVTHSDQQLVGLHDHDPQQPRETNCLHVLQSR